MQPWDSWINKATSQYGGSLDLSRRLSKMEQDPAYVQAGQNQKAKMRKNVSEGYAPFPTRVIAGRIGPVKDY